MHHHPDPEHYKTALSFLRIKLVQAGLKRCGGGLVLGGVSFFLLFLAGSFIFTRVDDINGEVTKLGGLLVAMIGTLAAFATYSVARHHMVSDLERVKGYFWNPSDEGLLFVVMILMWIIYCSPMLVYDGLAKLIASARLKDDHADDCAAVLGLMYQTGSKVSYAVLDDHFDYDRIDAVVRRLEPVDGVLLLQADPPGIALTDRLREEIASQI